MKRIVVLGLVFWLLSVLTARASVVCTFQGEADLLTKRLSLNFLTEEGGRLSFKASEDSQGKIAYDVSIRQLPFMVFDVETDIKGSAEVIEGAEGSPAFIKGIMVPGEKMEISSSSFGLPTGAFEIKDDKFFVQPLLWQGLTCRGYLALLPPYDMDFFLSFEKVPLEDLMLWIGAPEDVYVEGLVSGEMKIKGFFDKVFLTSELSSYDGQIADFYFDQLFVGFTGVYPQMQLTNASVTQKDGVSVDVEGEIDLSKDFKGFDQQLAKLKMAPLIRETDVHREWTLRKQKEEGREGLTEFKYRLRRSKELGVEESDMLSIQKSIKF